MDGPLTGVRVVELATGVAGPYAGRLLAMLGAEVVKLEPTGGDPSRRLAVDDGEPPDPSPAFVHLNAGKRLASIDSVDLEAAIDWAEIVLDDRVRRQVAGTELDPDRLGDRRLVLATTTAWGFDHHEPGTPQDELVVQAASGLMSATGEEGREPLRFPGWQSQYLAGGYAAATGLAMLHRAHEEFVHVDVAWVDAALSGVESGICAYLQPATRVRPKSGRRDDRDAASRQAGFQTGAFPSGAFRCSDGHVVPGTVRGVDWELQCQVYGRPDLRDDERFSWRTRWANRELLREELRPWYESHSKRDIFLAALDIGWAAAMVMTAEDVLADEHLAERRFLSKVEGAVDATIAGRPWRSHRVAEPPSVRLAQTGEDDVAVQETLGVAAARDEPIGVDLRSVKVLELTWAWAGPFVGRYLGALGSDVVRIEVGRNPDGWRTRLRWKDADVDIPDGVDPETHTWDAAALFNSLNRNKRGVSIDLTTDEGRAVFGQLLGRADVLIANMTYSVLADRGIEQDVHAAVERGLVFANMPALGATGPYRDMPGYGMLMEGMGGFAARFGYRDEGARASTTYYPDAVAGLHGSVAVLAALVDRARSGKGTIIDLSQQETTWLQYGEGIAMRSMTGREPDRIGNGEAGCTPSGVYPTSDGFVAITTRAEGVAGIARATATPAASFASDRDAADAALSEWTGSRTTREVVATLDAIDGVSGSIVHTFSSVYRSGALDERGLIDEVEHPVTGRRGYLAIPVRIDGGRLRSTSAAPVFAQHTDEVLQEWAGLSPDQIAALRDNRAIGTVPAAKTR